MKYVLVLGCITSAIMYASSVCAKTSAEIEQISRGITVKITSELTTGGDSDAGSGFIVRRQQDVYTVVTNRHVICPEEESEKKKALCTAPPAGREYNIITPDGKTNLAIPSEIKILGQDLDLAIIQFRSPNNYPVAQVNTFSTLKVDDIVYVGGFPAGRKNLLFSEGQSLMVLRKRLDGDQGGYTITYDASTLPGMSGCAMFDQEGRVVAIHGQGDKFSNLANRSTFDNGQARVKIGINRGIPVEHLISEFRNIQINIGDKNLNLASMPDNSDTIANEYLLRGYNEWWDSQRSLDRQIVSAKKRKAIELYSKSI